MRLNRLPKRSVPRRAGCLSLLPLLIVLAGMGFAVWAWLDTRSTADPQADAAAALRRAQAAFERGDLGAASEGARQSWQDVDNPANTGALLLLVRALVYHSYSDYDRELDRVLALEIASGAYDRYPTDSDIAAAYAFALQANDQPVRAARIAEGVLNRDPEHVLARIARGLGYAGAGGFSVALTENERAAAAESPLKMDALRALAIAYGDLGRYEEAAATIEAAIALNTRLIALHFERALYALQMGDTGAATAAYFRVLAFHPDNIKARLRMCELSSLLRESETALDYCQQVTERAPGWADGWYRLGREHYLRGDYPSAQAAFRRCTTLQIAQNVPIPERELDCWYLQGQAAEIQGDCPGLLRVYNQFRAMAAEANLPQTWTYPPEGPAICQP